MPIKITPLLVTLLVAISLLSPICGWAQNYPRSVTELAAKAKAQIKTIDLATFKSDLDKKGLGLIVDVREPGEYAEGHIPSAINIPRGQIELKIWPYVGFPDHADLHKRMTLYCGTGVRSILATKSLQDLRFTNVVAVDMKFEDWTKAGYPLEREDSF
jgi:rhodanese-related sulfurtransferase